MRLETKALQVRATSHLDAVTAFTDRVVPFRSFRPLQRLRSIKLKLSVLILTGIAMTVAGLSVSYWLDVAPALAVLASLAVALIFVQILARGITAPLREMSAAAEAMATGDLDQRVSASSNDEVGQLGASFNKMASHIADLERQRRDIIANVSHELRTPIAVIQGNLENIVDGVSDADEHSMQAMLRQTTRLSRLVEQLLDLSRLEGGAAPLRVQTIDLVELIYTVLQESEMAPDRPKIQVTTPGELLLVGDPARLHQVIYNVVDNALRFHSGEAAVQIVLSCVADQATLTIADSGPGIPPEDLERVFERFHRVDTDRSTAGGSGLGLAICRGIIELHNGTITAGNTDEGAEFRIQLPVGITTTS